MDAALRRSLLRSQLASAELHDYEAALFASALDGERNAAGSMRRLPDLADE